jgi:predicted flap endonuclease-1-like 5' DNA nuclease
MVLLQLNPFSKPVALSEILILLIAASFIGWLVARLITNRRIGVLRKALSERKNEFVSSQAPQKELLTVQLPAAKASGTVYPPSLVKTNPADASRADDFKIIEGIGAKIEELINKEGIYTYDQLSNTSPIRLSGILKKAGPRFQMHDPTSWPEQARLANEKRWPELQAIKEKLIAGRPL